VRGEVNTSKMKGIKNLWKLLTLVAVLSTVVSTPIIMNAAASPTTIYAVEPVNSFGDPTDTFTVSVKVYDADCMYSWQVHMVWDDALLEFSDLAFGGFLADQPEGSDINARVEAGWLIVGEATKGQYVGKSAPEGLLVNITFLVNDVGGCDLNIYSDYTYYYYCFQPPMTEKHYPTRENGYFRTIAGDIDGDRDVDPSDFYLFSGAYGTSPPSDPRCDLDNDGDVDPGDFYVFSGNYGKTI